MITERINIDVRPGGVPVVIHVTQYEAGLRQFIFTPYASNGELTVVAGSATLEGTKPDGYAFQQACEMVDGVVTYTLQEQLCAVEGRVWSRLVIRDTDGGMIGYTAIVWVVGRAGVADDAVMSDSDISALRQFLDEFGEIDAYRGVLNQTINNVDVLSARMDSFARLPDGSLSTAADAELADIRVGANAITYPDAGTSVRQQVANIQTASRNLFKYAIYTYGLNGLTGRVDEKQQFVLSGTPTANGVATFSKDVTLPAGSYVFGSPTGLADGTLTLQIRKVVNGADAGAVATAVGSTSFRAFTLSEETTVRFRLAYYNGKVLDNIVQPMLLSGSWLYSFIPPYTADDEELRLFAYQERTYSTADFNTMTDPGYYPLYGSTVYGNSPAELPSGGKGLIVHRSVSSRYIIQILFYFKNNTADAFELYIRTRNTPTNWNAWRKVYDWAELAGAVAAVGTLETTVDTLETTVDTLETTVDGIVDASRYEDNQIAEMNTDTFTGGLENKGVTLRVLSYNVAKYNNDTTVQLPEEKRFNFKKMLSKINPDIVCVQEEREYIDADSQKSTPLYIYNPVYPYKRGGNNLGIYSKFNIPGGAIVRYTDDRLNNREFRFGTYEVNGKTVLIGDTHLTARHNGDITISWDAPESIADRAEEYEKMMQFVSGEITLAYYSNGWDSTRRMSCPAWDYCIICGDMNSGTSQDQSNLKTQATARNFTLANGGWLGWMPTNQDKDATTFICTDNILCSPGVILNSITVHKSLYPSLYSDHYPLSADVTLCGA